MFSVNDGPACENGKEILHLKYTAELLQTHLSLPSRNLLLPLHLCPLPLPPLLLNPHLIRASNRNILGAKITKRLLEHLLNDPTAHIIHHHDRRHGKLELGAELDQTEFLVEFGDEFGRGGKGDGGDEDETPVHAAVLADGFAKGPALVVDGEGGDLLDQLE